MSTNCNTFFIANSPCGGLCYRRICWGLFCRVGTLCRFLFGLVLTMTRLSLSHIVQPIPAILDLSLE